LNTDALRYRRGHADRFLGELKDFIRFPSVSSDPARAGSVKECAAWLAGHLKHIGLERVKTFPGTRHPIVYAEWKQAQNRPTVLIYGHYDIQPAEPLREWKSPPFQPRVRGRNLLGRGASDDKGQMFTHVKALESYLRTAGKLPVNVKCLFEGEEEIGSPSLAGFLARNKRALRADAAVISDTQMLAPDRPAISYAERGALSVELEVSGPRRDLHSGNFGGAVHNPAQALCEILASLHDSGGRVAIPGFYDSVRATEPSERAHLAHAGPSGAQILTEAGERKAWGEIGYTTYERTTIRPALTINGIKSGHQGPGGKGIIPASATAKLSFRLVPDQVPEKIAAVFRRHIERIVPDTVQVRVKTLSGAKPVMMDPRHQALSAAAFAYRKGFGATPRLVRSGGTIPPVIAFQETLGIPAVLMGFGLPADNIHAPNEQFHLPNFFKGIDTSIWFLAAMGAQRS